MNDINKAVLHRALENFWMNWIRMHCPFTLMFMKFQKDNENEPS